MSHPARKPTLWPLRNNSTNISLHSLRRRIRADTFRLNGIVEVIIPETEIHRRQKVSIWVSLCGMLRLIRVDTLRKIHNFVFVRGMAQILFTIRCFTCRPYQGKG